MEKKKKKRALFFFSCTNGSAVDISLTLEVCEFKFLCGEISLRSTLHGCHDAGSCRGGG